jgi:hypothetical protein
LLVVAGSLFIFMFFTKHFEPIQNGYLYFDFLVFYVADPSIIRIIKSQRMRWAGHVARMGEKRNAYRLLVGKLEGKESTRKTKT